MSKHYGISTEYEHNKTHKRDRISLWSGAYFDQFEGIGESLPKRNGYMLTMQDGRKVRVSCPCPRTIRNFHEVDTSIRNALNQSEGGDA